MNAAAQTSALHAVREFAFRPGERPVGEWTIVQPLASSELGETYLGEDVARKRVVLRRLTAAAAEEARGRKLAVETCGPHLAADRELQPSAGEAWRVRAYITRRNLADVVAAKPDGLRLKEALRWLEGIGAGLRFLEQHGAFHGRLKPSNVWLVQGVVMLTDHGLPPTVAPGANNFRRSALGPPLSARYAAPETARGRFDKADLYACGALLVEMLTGRVFDADEDWRSRLAEPYRPILTRILDPDPARRFGRLDEFLESLRAAPQDLPPPQVEPSPVPTWSAGARSFRYVVGERPLAGYTIVRPIGLGASGEVYQAASDGGKTVALKLLQRNLEVELRGICECLRLPRHEHLLQLHDVRQAADGAWWVVMDYADGPSLADVLREAGGPLSPRMAAWWMQGVLAGLESLHAAGIVHRDLKPQNVLLGDGVVKIADYGLAKAISASRRQGHTETVGTLAYSAPEIAQGRYGREVDLYACGAMLYEMLVGHVPFDGESAAEVLYKHLLNPPPLNALPPPLRPVVAKALAKEPSQRIASAGEMREALERALADEPVVATRSKGWLRPSHLWFSAAACMVILAATLTLVRFLAATPTDGKADPRMKSDPLPSAAAR